jgi:hypothetical protein
MPLGKPVLSAVLRIGANLTLLGAPQAQRELRTIRVPMATFRKLQDETKTQGEAVVVRTSWGRIEVRT